MLLKIMKSVFGKIEDLNLEKDSKQKMMTLMNQVLEQIQHRESLNSKKSTNSSTLGRDTNESGTVRNNFVSGGGQSCSKDNLDESITCTGSTGKINNDDPIDLAYIYESYYPAHWMMHSTILSIAQ